MNQAVLQLMMSLIGTFGFSLLFNVREKKLLLASLGGMFCWGIFLLLEKPIPGEPLRFFFCASFVAVYAEILARILKTPATTFLIPCMLPLIPGSALYTTMRLALNRQWSKCLSQALYTLSLSLSLALGIIAVLSVFGVMNQVLNLIWYKKNRNKERTQ